MSLKAHQKVLGILYTSRHARENFLQDRQAFLSSFPLTDEAKKSLLLLDEHSLHFFSTGLMNKRWGVVKNLIHDLVVELGEDAKKIFMEYAADVPLHGRQHKHSIDAVAFCRFLKNHPLLKDLPYAKSLATKLAIQISLTFDRTHFLLFLLESGPKAADRRKAGQFIKKRLMYWRLPFSRHWNETILPF